MKFKDAFILTNVGAGVCPAHKLILWAGQSPAPTKKCYINYYCAMVS